MTTKEGQMSRGDTQKTRWKVTTHIYYLKHPRNNWWVNWHFVIKKHLVRAQERGSFLNSLVSKYYSDSENFMHKKQMPHLIWTKWKSAADTRYKSFDVILAFGCIKKKFKNTSFMNKFQVSFLSLFYFPSKINLLRS